MAKRGKKYQEAVKLIDKNIRYPLAEAVELAKSFGGDNSSKFVNGVLGTLIKQKEDGKLPQET